MQHTAKACLEGSITFRERVLKTSKTIQPSLCVKKCVSYSIQRPTISQRFSKLSPPRLATRCSLRGDEVLHGPYTRGLALRRVRGAVKEPARDLLPKAGFRSSSEDWGVDVKFSNYLKCFSEIMKVHVFSCFFS